jgi:hypothetical protein
MYTYSEVTPVVATLQQLNYIQLQAEVKYYQEELLAIITRQQYRLVSRMLQTCVNTLNQDHEVWSTYNMLKYFHLIPAFFTI